MVWAAVVIPAKNQELSVSRLYTGLYVTSTQSFGKWKTVDMSKQLCVRIARKWRDCLGDIHFIMWRNIYNNNIKMHQCFVCRILHSESSY